MNHSPITNVEYPQTEIKRLNERSWGLGWGRTYGILGIAVGVFLATLLGGLLLLPRESDPSEAMPVEAECLVWLPRYPFGSDRYSTLEEFGMDENLAGSSETFRSWILNKGVLIPPEISIQLRSSQQNPPSVEIDHPLARRPDF